MTREEKYTAFCIARGLEKFFFSDLIELYDKIISSTYLLLASFLVFSSLIGIHFIGWI